MLAGVALLRGRPRIAVAVLLLVAATSVSSQLLKALLAYPREPSVGASAFPSGHSTAAMTLAFCGVLVAPARLRPLAALLGLVFALGVALGVVSLGWHFPSDVVGGYLLATGWTLAVVSGLLWLEERRPERPGRATIAVRAAVDRVAAVGLVTAVVAGAALVSLVVVVVLVTRRPDLGGFVQRHTAAVVVAPLIVAAGARAARSRHGASQARRVTGAPPAGAVGWPRQTAGGPGKSGEKPARSRHCDRATKRRTTSASSHWEAHCLPGRRGDEPQARRPASGRKTDPRGKGDP